MFLISEQMQNQNITCNILPGIPSDHSLVQLQFSETTDWVRGRGFWKFNVDLLKDKEYIAKVNDTFEEFKTAETTLNNKALSWDYIKCRLRGLTISHASFKAKKRKRREKFLNDRLSFLEEKLGDKPSLEQLNQYSEVKQELEHIFLEKVKGSAIRSRAEFIENNGRNSRYFLALEKKNFNLKCIKCLNTKHGQITYESKILKEI